MSCMLFAQSVQSGIVLEYDGTATKKPLANVEIVVNNAQSTVSDSHGRFKLQFRTLKAGDRIVVRRITKNGYEIINQEVIDRWIITRDPNALITIEMSSSARIKKERDKYLAIANKKYSESLDNDRTQLRQKLSQGVITQQEFREKIEELRNMYENQLENIDNYIDRFVRIDTFNISKEEARVLSYINAGEYEKALEISESHDLISQYNQLNESYQKLKNSEEKLSTAKEHSRMVMDSIETHIQNQISLLCFMGGKENFEKALELKRELALANPENATFLVDYADMALDFKEYDTAMEYYDKALALLKEDVEKSTSIHYRKGATYLDMNKFDEAKYEAITALHDLDSIKESLGDEKYKLEARSYSQYIIGVALYELNDFELSAQYLSYSAGGYYFLSEESPNDHKISLAQILVYYARSCGAREDSIGAVENFQRAISLFEELYKETPSNVSGNLGIANSYLGKFLSSRENYSEAEPLLTRATDLFKEAYEFNPFTYTFDYAENYIALGNLHLKTNDIGKAEDEFNKAYAIYENSSRIHPEVCKPYMADIENSLANLSWSKQEYDGSIEHYTKSKDIYEELYKQYPDAYYLDLAKTYFDLGNCYYVKNQYEISLDYFTKASEMRPNYDVYINRRNRIRRIMELNNR